MNQDVVIKGTEYEDVPSVKLDKSGGGTADFVEISDTTATASDVYNNKVFYNASGVRTVGNAQPSVGGTIIYDGESVLDTSYDALFLKDVGSGIEDIELLLNLELLWENPTPTVEMPGATSTGVNPFEYKIIIIFYRYQISISGYATTLIIPNALGGADLHSTMSDPTPYSNSYRGVTCRYYDDVPDITFGQGYHSNIVDNSYIIPYKIYGIK